jgi:8-oxo-dGTP pyrophosphatase MutT (NUDIX family)
MRREIMSQATDPVSKSPVLFPGPTQAQSRQDERIDMLRLSRGQCHDHFYLTRKQHFVKIVIGAAISYLATAPESELDEPRILLLKRSADERHYPNVFEMPGGKVDSEDLPIRDALSREVKEETGLDLTHVLSQLPDMTYSTEKTIQREDRTEQRIRKSCIQLNYAIMVDYTHGLIFRVNPSEQH